MKLMVPTAEHVDLFKAVHEHPEVVRAAQKYDDQCLIYYDKAQLRWVLARCTERGFRIQRTWDYELEDGTTVYRKLDMDLVKWMMSFDRWRLYDSAEKAHKEMQDRQEDHHEKSWKNFDDDIDYLSRWNRKQQQDLKTMLTI